VCHLGARLLLRSQGPGGLPLNPPIVELTEHLARVCHVEYGQITVHVQGGHFTHLETRLTLKPDDLAALEDSFLNGQAGP
jgi:hypothetical protein